MGKLFKILFSLVALLLIIVFALPFVVDPNDYKNEIVSAVEEHTGRQLTIDGDLKLSVFPWVGIEIGKMTLGNAPGFENKAFTAINSASVRIKLMPLFSSELEADTVTLDGLTLNLAKNSKGVTNWADLAGGATEEKATQPADNSKSSSAGLGALAIGGVAIKNATINWDDQQLGRQYQVKDFNLTTGAIFPGKPMDIDLSMLLNSSEPAIESSVALSGTVALAGDLSKVSLAPFKLNIDANGATLPNGKLAVSMSSEIDVNLQELAVKLSKLQLSSGKLSINGDINATQLQTEPAVSGQLSVTEMNLKAFLTDLGITLPPMSNDSALSSFKLNASLDANANQQKVSNLQIMLDQSTINGSLAQSGTHSDFDLKIDQINLDHYLPESANKDTKTSSSPSNNNKTPATTAVPAKGQAGSQKAAAPSASAGAKEAPLLPVDILRSLDLAGTLEIGKLIVSKLTSEQVKAKVSASKGMIKLDSNIGKFYDGIFNAKTTINTAGKTPKMAVNASLKNLQAGPMILDLTEKDMIAGTGGFNANLNTFGNTVSALKKGLNGKLDLALEDGAVKGFNLAKILRDAKARFSGEAVSTTNEPEQTDFSTMSASATITNGILDNRDLLAKSPFLRVNGAGTVNLPAETLDYTVEATIVETSKGQGGKELADLKGLNIPVKLSGSLMAPKYEIDFGKVLLSSQQAKIDEKVEEKKQELQQKLEEKLGTSLKGLFR